jgi:hypothetical protein
MVLPTGYTVSLVNGPLKKDRYINPAIEQELVEFKVEIKQKFEASEMNRNYVFPIAVNSSVAREPFGRRQ